MHEYSLVASVIDRVEREARERRATSVERVRVRVGELSGVEPELFASAWELARAATLCERAALEVERVAASWGCAGCGRVLAAGQRLACLDCGGDVRLLAGDELLLEQIEMEVPDV